METQLLTGKDIFEAFKVEAVIDDMGWTLDNLEMWKYNGWSSAMTTKQYGLMRLFKFTIISTHNTTHDSLIFSVDGLQSQKFGSLWVKHVSPLYLFNSTELAVIYPAVVTVTVISILSE